MNAKYRCMGCRHYKSAPAHRKVGLGGVCSDECHATIVGKARTTSAAKPRDDIPVETRRIVALRDRAKCRWCGEIGVHLHHITYRSEGVDHSPENLITLCRRHHDQAHSNKKRWKPVLQAVIVAIYAGRPYSIQRLDREINPQEPEAA